MLIQHSQQPFYKQKCFYSDVLSFKDYMILILCEWKTNIELCLNDTDLGGRKYYSETILS